MFVLMLCRHDLMNDVMLCVLCGVMLFAAVSTEEVQAAEALVTALQFEDGFQ